MMPIQFGRADRIMYGVFTPAVGKRLRRGVVLCNPLGVEAMRAHRSIRMLADVLARAGFDVLRFDYFGTGDSFGDGLSGSLEDWCADTELAVDELAEMAGVRKIALVGLRLGAYVAAVCAARLTRRIDRLVLWDAVVDGSAYLDELMLRGSANDRHEVLEVGGYPVPQRLQQELRTVRFDGLPGRDMPVLAAWSERHDENVLREVMAGTLTSEVRESPACWLEENDFGAGAVPMDLLQTIGAWLK
ncbi:MAG: hypothetical protein DIU71_16660 [Proteobacteria bacterium]|nr:MAG: hypothetical protein DIU71_16660 [Pseudomonadota bacterium]